jgi:hypothetical protein
MRCRAAGVGRPYPGGIAMAGFFGFFDYAKEGKGVYPDEPPKGPIATFFAIFGRKFWKIVTVNLMYILFSLPIFLLAFLAAQYCINFLLPNLSMETFIQFVKDAGLTLQQGITEETFAASQMVTIYLLTAMTLVGLTLVVAGPVHAGIVYILRNYSREEHAFVWSDFKEHAVKNLKQSLLASLINLGVVALIPFIYWFYSTYSVLGNGVVSGIIQAVIIMLTVLWCMMQIYLYPMMVTFDMPLKVMYKNCLMFAMLRLPLNLVILLLVLIIMVGIPGVLLFLAYNITFLITFLWYGLIAFGLTIFITTFFAYRAIDKYMIAKIKAAEEMNEQEDEDVDGAAEPEEEPEEEEAPAEKPKKKDDPGLTEAPSHSPG